MKDKNGLNENGCGLGLTICKKLSESMQGKILVESQLGVGSTFKFYTKYYKTHGDHSSQMQSFFFDNEDSFPVSFNL